MEALNKSEDKEEIDFKPYKIPSKVLEFKSFRYTRIPVTQPWIADTKSSTNNFRKLKCETNLN
jgi:hypothetical protein